MPERSPFDDLDPELLDRYLAGECSEDETALVRRWLMARPDAARDLARYLGQAEDEAARTHMPDVASSWRALRARMGAMDSGAIAPPREVRRASRSHPQGTRSPAWQWAAVAVAACTLLAAGLSYSTRRDRTPIVVAGTLRTYTTAVRERSDLRLPDGTRVRLAPGSQLRAAPDFGKNKRDVYLEGEAYFEVVHDDRRPFTVFAGNTSTRDIGTAFSIRAYPQDSAVTVVVREGEVDFSGVGRLFAGEVGRVTTEGAANVQRGVRVDSLLGWMSGRLTMTDAPLGQVLEDLRRWYDIDVRLADSSIASLPFTGTLGDVSPNAAVELVAATLGLRITRVGASVVLAPIPGKTPPSR